MLQTQEATITHQALKFKLLNYLSRMPVDRTKAQCVVASDDDVAD